MADQNRTDPQGTPDSETSSPRRVFLHAALAGAAATSLLGLGCGDDATGEGSGGSGSTSSGPGSTGASGSTTAGAGPTGGTTTTTTTGTPASSTGSGEGGSGEGGAGPTTSSGTTAGGGGAGGGTPSCEETEDDIEGPFYEDEAPFVEDGVLPGADALPGVALTLSGRVLSLTDCAPLAGAVLDIWQADDDGDYSCDEAGRCEIFTLRGRVRTDAQGRYSVRTIIPGNYLNGNQFRPAHIHVKASAQGHALLTTQLYFPDDPYNDIDPWFDARLLIDTQDIKGAVFGTFDFTLVPS